MAGEKEFWVSAGASQSGGLRVKARVYWGFFAASQASGECWTRTAWRRERDSNPRYGFPHTHFPGVRLQPLGHPSAVRIRASGWSS